MSNPPLKVLLALFAGAMLAGSAGAAVSTDLSPDDPRELIRAVNANEGRSYPVVRVLGGNPDTAQAIGKTSRGITLSVVASSEGRCVLFSDATELCATDGQVRSGRSSRVDVDCSRSGGDMDITAVMPGGTVKALVAMSDGSMFPMQVARGVAWLDAHVPAVAEPHVHRRESTRRARSPAERDQAPNELVPRQLTPWDDA